MQCPYCAEEIKSDAIVCRFCHRDLFFYQPLAAKLEALEKRTDALTSLVEQLQMNASTMQVVSERKSAPRRAWLDTVALIVGATISVGTYALFIQNTDTPLLLWLSILTPMVVGAFLGFVSANERDLRSYLALGIGMGLLNSAGVVAVLIPYVTHHGLRINWQDVLSLYFLPPFLLVTFGGFLGEWLKRGVTGQAGTPLYARRLAQVLVNSTQSDAKGSSQSLDYLAKFIAAVTPLLTFIASIISATLTFLAATRLK